MDIGVRLGTTRRNTCLLCIDPAYVSLSNVVAAVSRLIIVMMGVSISNDEPFQEKLGKPYPQHSKSDLDV